MRHMLKNRFWIVAILCLVLALSCEDAFAQRGRGGRGRGGFGRGGRGFAGRHSRYYYRGGSWYRHGWLGADIAFSALAMGALIDSLPPRYTTVVVGGAPYYYYDNYYYRPYYNGGYVVVPPPVLAGPVMVPQAAYATANIAQSQPQIQEESTVNIPNARGGYTAVTLRRAGTGYVGPQGEYYSDNPTVAQLRVLYGK